MNAYELPTSLTVGGVGYPIRSGWMAAIDILIAMCDPELDDMGKQTVMLQILYPGWKDIPPEHVQEALKQASDFIDCGQKDDGKPKPQMIDWEQDAALIIPEINKALGKDIRLDRNIHWWTAFGGFMCAGDGLLASVLHIRQKKAKRKKLEKWELEFYRENRELCDIRPRETDEIRAEKDNILKWLGGR